VSTEKIQALESLLNDVSERFNNYQRIPQPILDQHPELGDLSYQQNQLVLDEERYRWLLENGEIAKGMSVVELGASLGYFSLSLAKSFDANVTAYEPIKEYSQATQLIAEISSIDNQLKTKPFGPCLEDLDGIPESDLHINLNVLHHGGNVFDREKAEELGGWRNYAKTYLSKLATKAKFLFFQTGNVADGVGLFPGLESVPYLKNLLEESGWEVVAVGVNQNLPELNYTTYKGEGMVKAPLYHCARNTETNLVDYFQNDQKVASLETGLAQRPLWFCRRR